MKWRSPLMEKLLLAAFLMLPTAAFALSVGQVDTFEDGSTQNWVVSLGGAQGHPEPPVIENGGPDGGGDHFLRLKSDSSEVVGNKLSVINVTQWIGDFLTAGIGAISMDLKNLGETDLFLRLMVADFELANGLFDTGNIALSAQPVSLPAGSDWVRVEFPMTPSDLIAASGNAAAALRNVIELRMMHDPAASLPPPVVDARLGVDNITAIAATAATVVGDASGYCACTVGPGEPLSCLLHTGNSGGISSSQIAQEWLVIGFGPIATGIPTQIFFLTGQGTLVSLEQAMSNPAAATFPFNHAGNSHFLGNLTLGAAGIGSGNFLIYAYAFSTTAVSDFGNAPDLVIENVVLLNVQ